MKKLVFVLILISLFISPTLTLALTVNPLVVCQRNRKYCKSDGNVWQCNPQGSAESMIDDCKSKGQECGLDEYDNLVCIPLERIKQKEFYSELYSLLLYLLIFGGLAILFIIWFYFAHKKMKRIKQKARQDIQG